MRLGPGALYGAITRLEERGLIEPLDSDDRRRPYRITAAGSAALAGALADLRRVARTGLVSTDAGRPFGPTAGRAPRSPRPGQMSVLTPSDSARQATP